MFKSIFAKEIPAFLELRRANVSQQTFAYDIATLSDFDQYLAGSDFRDKDLTEEILATWIKTCSTKSKATINKVLVIRNFVKYLNGLGNNSFIPDLPKVKSKYIPYIYSDEELSLLIHYADNMEVKRLKLCSPFLLAKVPLILRILYGCGTRLGETLALRRKDIDFDERTIYFRETKFSKERRIPAHETLMSIIERYCLLLDIMRSPDAYLFPSVKPGCPFPKRQMRKWFSKLLRLANIDQREKVSGERGACLHCLRHVFVLKSMQQLEAAGHPVDMNDLLLPTYLGHERLLYKGGQTTALLKRSASGSFATV